MLVVFDGETWQPLLQNVAQLGIGTAADEVNPFAARLNNALWTALYEGEGGDGDLRYKLNKEAPSNVLSLLMQSGWSGRAEIGLTGDDDLHVKVSDDGSTWRDGMIVAAATGKVSFPHGVIGMRERLTAARTYYVRTDGNDANDGLSNTSGGAFLTIQKALDVVFGMLDLGGFDVTIQLADGTYTAGVNQASPQVGAGLVTIQGNVTSPENVLVSTTSGHVIRAAGGAVLHVKDVKLTGTGGSALLAATGGFMSYSNIHVGSTGSFHQIRAEDGGRITCLGNYTIAGGGQSHFNALSAGVIRCQARTISLTGTPAYSAAFAVALLNGSMIVNGNTFSGSATGKRYDAATGGVIYTLGGATYFPGTVDGTTATGGQYG